jgi:hypothetical protein
LTLFTKIQWYLACRGLPAALDFLKQKLLLVYKVLKEWSEAKGAADYIEGGKPTGLVINYYIKWLLRLITRCASTVAGTALS